MVEMFEQIWSTLPFPCFVLDDQNKVEQANSAAEQFAKTSLKQMLKRDIGYFFGQDSIVVETILQTREHDTGFTQYGVDVATVNAAPMSCNLHVNYLDFTSGRILLIIQPTGVAEKMSQSITHLTAARSVSAMAAALAHEIRNPLAGITGAAQLLAMNANQDDQNLAEMIGQEARRIGGLVDRVEHFGDLRPTNRTAINIHDILDRTLRSAQAGYAAHVTFIKEYDPSLPDAFGEADQLMQVFQNIIKNAAEALGERPGTIRLRTSYNSGVKFAVTGGRTENLPLQIDITDNGPGIPKDLLPEIFEPFVSSKSDGTGLGLSLVSKIVAGHGGLIECNSKEGRTVFTLRLPIAPKRKG